MTPHDDNPGIQHQIFELGQRWAQAELRGDVADLGTFLHDDFVAVGPRGFVLTKDQWLERYRSGDLKNASFGLEDVRVVEHGEMALAVGSQTQEATYKGHDAGGRFRVTLVAGKRGDRWIILACHLSPIAGTPTG